MGSFARRGSIGAAVTAGLIAALGITIRPNLAPLALVPALAMLSAAQGRRQRAWRPLAAFCATVAIGPLLVFWSQAALYGSPVESGYPAADSFFRLAHAAVNLRTYPRLLLDTLGWGLPTMAIVGLLLYPHASTASRRAAVEALGFIVINALLYVWYLPYDHWPFVRFFLPASTAFAVGASALAADGCRSWPPLRRVVLGTGLVILVLSSAWHARAFTGFALGDWLSQRRVLVMGHYLRQVLPANAVVIGHVHTGAVAHYTGRLVVRPDRLDGTALDRLILDLERHGFSPFLVIDEQLEEPQFRQVFRASTYGALDWPPRAEFVSTARIRVFDPADRARLRAGASWPIDRVH